MGGKAGKHGRRSGASPLPTSAARRKYLRKRARNAKTRSTSRAGKLLEPKWAKEFVDAGYKYVFVQVPLKGNVPSRKVSALPDQPKKTVPAGLSNLTPEADIIFGNDLDDLKFFDSKRQNTTSFSKAQRIVYPQINKNGGEIALKEGTSLRNLADGQMVEIDGVKIKPGTAHVGFKVDLSAVASGQKDLNSLLKERAGNLHPPASDLNLEDSRMVSERRARYRNRPSPASKTAKTNKPKPKIDLPPQKLKKPFVPKKVGLPVGLAANLIIDYTIGRIIQNLERELDAANQAGIKMLWKSEIYPKIKDQINLAISLERNLPKDQKDPPIYIKLDWEVLLRLQMKDALTDSVVWAFKFVHGDPGFAEVFEGVNYIGHEAVGYFSKSKTKKKNDSSDNTLVHEIHQDFILIWDPEVHSLASKYRALALKAITQLNKVFTKTMKVISTISSTKGKTNAKDHLTQSMDKISAALNRYDFKDAKRYTRLLVQHVNGQFRYSKVYEYRIERVQVEIKILKTVLAGTFDIYKISKKHKKVQQDLLAMFMGQKYNRLH